MAAAGTPDPGTTANTTTDCAIISTLSNTGSRTNCVSNWGVNDMVGNVWEWVADWMQDNSDIDNGSTSTFGTDDILGVDETDFDRFPAALIRGGSWNEGAGAGVFAMDASISPAIFGSAPNQRIWFRCAR